MSSKTLFDAYLLIFEYTANGWSFLLMAATVAYILTAHRAGLRTLLWIALSCLLLCAYSCFASGHTLIYLHPLRVPWFQIPKTLAMPLMAIWIVGHAPELRYMCEIWGKVRAETAGRLTNPPVHSIRVRVRLRGVYDRLMHRNGG